jgi:hypothetical protein
VHANPLQPRSAAPPNMTPIGEDKNLTLCRRIYAQFGLPPDSLGHREKKQIKIRGEVTCSRTGPCRDLGDAFKPIALTALDHIDEAFAAGDVEPLAFGVEEEVVGVAGDFQICHGGAV